jgi:hypothetical protein
MCRASIYANVEREPRVLLGSAICALLATTAPATSDRARAIANADNATAAIYAGAEVKGAVRWLQRIHEINQVLLILRAQAYAETRVVKLHQLPQGCRIAIVEVRRASCQTI